MTQEEKEAEKEALRKKIEKFLQILGEGNRIETACVISGLSYLELCKLRKVPEFDHQVRQAQVLKERMILDSLTRAAIEGNTDAARWILERKSEEYMSMKDRRNMELAEERWRMEKKIIKAELEADPHRVAANSPKRIAPVEDEPLEMEDIGTSGEGEEG